MTLILTEISHAGVAMTADSAISFLAKNGEIRTRNQPQWKKLLAVSHIRAGVSYWGNIGQIVRERFDGWLERKIAKRECYSDVRSLANYLAEQMNAAAGGKPIAHPAGVHVAGFQTWTDGILRPTFYHVHNGDSTIVTRHGHTANGKVVTTEFVDNTTPRTLFFRYNDFSDENPNASDQIALLADATKIHLTSNGDYYPFQIIAGGLKEIFDRLNTIPKVAIPRDPTKLGSHVRLVRTLMDITVSIYKCSTMSQTIGGKIRVLGIPSQGAYLGDYRD